MASSSSEEGDVKYYTDLVMSTDEDEERNYQGLVVDPNLSRLSSVDENITGELQERKDKGSAKAVISNIVDIIDRKGEMIDGGDCGTSSTSTDTVHTFFSQSSLQRVPTASREMELLKTKLMSLEFTRNLFVEKSEEQMKQVLEVVNYMDENQSKMKNTVQLQKSMLKKQEEQGPTCSAEMMGMNERRTTQKELLSKAYDSRFSQDTAKDIQYRASLEELERLKKDNSTLTADNYYLKKEKKSLMESNNSLKKDIQTYVERNTQLCKENERYIKKKDELEMDLINLSREKKDLTLHRDLLLDGSNKLSLGDKNRWDVEKKSLIADKERLTMETKEMTKKNEILLQLKNALSQDKQQLLEEKSTSSKDFERVTQDSKKLSQCILEITGEKKTLSKKNEDLLLKIGDLEVQLKRKDAFLTGLTDTMNIELTMSKKVVSEDRWKNLRKECVDIVEKSTKRMGNKEEEILSMQEEQYKRMIAWIDMTEKKIKFIKERFEMIEIGQNTLNENKRKFYETLSNSLLALGKERDAVNKKSKKTSEIISMLNAEFPCEP